VARKDISDKEVIEVYLLIEKENLKEEPYEILSRLTGQAKKVCYRAMERAFEREYLEYGVSLRCAWVTNKGMELYNNKK